MLNQLKTSFIMLLFLSLLTGIIYPLVVTGAAQLLFPWQANGSTVDNKGSLLIGQSFSSDHYFWSRPSATTPFPYNAQSSSGSNSGPSNPDYLNTVADRISAIQKADPDNKADIPVDLVTASGSGLDPEISPAAAHYQVARVAKARGIPQEELTALVNKVTRHRTFGILGEKRVNVLELNLALDKINYDR